MVDVEPIETEIDADTSRSVCVRERVKQSVPLSRECVRVLTTMKRKAKQTESGGVYIFLVVFNFLLPFTC